MTPEGKVKQRVDAILSKHTNVIINPVTKGYGKSGAADKIVCVKGMFLAIETKSTAATGAKKFPTKLQYRFLANVLRCGGYVAVINEDNLDHLDIWLSELIKSNGNVGHLIMFDGCDHPYSASEASKVTT